ncbi:MAG: hypothetical protein H6895_12190 [Defluviimonas sp.]|uniref:hypothetical protein n=1 Tax=Albidovulum sp. TaxID=1872424 RepID=UPI002A3342FE|nr:hypothetical protein [Defluviimonas sp.]
MVLAALMAVSADAALAQEADVDPTPLASVYVKIGCRGNEKDLMPYFGSEIDTSTFMAQFKALRASGNLVSDDNGETMRLTNWGECK